MKQMSQRNWSQDFQKFRWNLLFSVGCWFHCSFSFPLFLSFCLASCLCCLWSAEKVIKTWLMILIRLFLHKIPFSFFTKLNKKKMSPMIREIFISLDFIAIKYLAHEIFFYEKETLLQSSLSYKYSGFYVFILHSLSSVSDKVCTMQSRRGTKFSRALHSNGNVFVAFLG